MKMRRPHCRTITRVPAQGQISLIGLQQLLDALFAILGFADDLFGQIVLALRARPWKVGPSI